MPLRAGTSGFSYDAWKGAFYPEDLPAKRRLEYYATRLGAIEINNTFYRMPRASVLESWAEQVPEDFRFAIKASRRITHSKRLKDAADETGYLMETVRVLGPRLGCVLFQLPPNLKPDAERLEAFLDVLPADLPAAFEFRHPGWQDAPILDLLRAHGRAWVGVDSEDAPLDQLCKTADWGYLRLRGQVYDEDALGGWVKRIVDTGWRDSFVFFKHEDAGAGPRLAEALQDLSREGEGAGVRPVRPARARRRRA